MSDLKEKKQAKKRFFEIVDQIRERNKDVPYEQIEKDVAQAVVEARQIQFDNSTKPSKNKIYKKNKAKQKVMEFIRELREYNKDVDPEEIQADIDEAVRDVKNQNK